jgi:hypothetical protein
MDFWDFKKKALKFKDDIVEKWAKKLISSSLVINKIDDLEEFIKKSETNKFTSKETGETKEFIKKVIVIFSEKESDFFKNILVWLPILVTKAFSQNIPLKMCDIDIKDLSEYKIKNQPCLVVFETKKVIKIIEWEENISKIVKKLNIDITKAIEEF